MMSSQTALIGTHDTGLVVLSVVIAIVASYAALEFAGCATAAQGRARSAWLSGGAVTMGTGIFAMHFIGMLGFGLPMAVLYHAPAVFVSLAAAIFASAIALYVVSRPALRVVHVCASGVVMGLGIVTMHYTGMAAMRMQATINYDLRIVLLSVAIAIVVSLVGLWLLFLCRDETKAFGWRKIGAAVVMGLAIPSMHYTAMAAASYTPNSSNLDLSSTIEVSFLGTTTIVIATFLFLSLAVLAAVVDRRIVAQTAGRGQAAHPAFTGRQQTPYPWLLPLMIVMIVAVLTIGSVTLYYVETRLVASTGESLALAAADITDKLDLILSERYGDIQVFAHAAVFQGYDPKAKSKYLTWLRERYPLYLWIAVTDARGTIIASTRPSSIGKDRSAHEWFRAVRDSQAIHVRDAQESEDSGGVIAVAFTAPIKDPRGEFLGVVTTRVGLPVLEDVFASTARTLHLQRGVDAGKIEWQLMTRDGDLIADSLLHEEGRTNLKLLGLPSALFTGSAQPGYVEEMHLRRHVPVVTGYAKTEQYGNFVGLHWGILVRMNRSDILAPVQTVLWKLEVAGALVFVPMLGFLFWFTGRLRHEWTIAQEKTARAAKAEAEARESDARTRLIINTALDAVIVMDADGRITEWNPQAEAIFGWTRDEAVGRTLADTIIPPQYREAHARGLKHFLVTGEGPVLNKRIEITALHRDGREFPVELTISPLRSGETLTFSAFVRDITERKQLTLHAKRLAKMEALEQILDGIAHELKNPLFIVTGNLQLLKEKLERQPKDESLIADINQIEEAARRMDAIVRKFMLLAKPEKSSAVPCSVQSAVQDVLDMLVNDLMKRRVTVATRFALKLPDVLSEPAQLREVFLNLILNAAQAMETAHGRGTLTVSTGQTDGWIEVRFQDDGPGVPPEYQAKIFEPFFSTKPLHEGTGLGLWTVRSIVRGLKGEIRYESEPGSGATFIVRLPGMR